MFKYLKSCIYTISCFVFLCIHIHELSAQSPQTQELNTQDHLDVIKLRAPKAVSGTSQLTYLIAQVSHARLGMSLQELFKYRPQEQFTQSTTSSIIYLQEFTPKDPLIESIIYQFNNQGLYEMILMGRQEGDAERIAEFLLKEPPNAPNDHWLRDSGEGFDMIFWIFQKNFIIAHANYITY